jgi:hypothetical protein
MAIARTQLVDLSVTRWYHCVTRCVRRAFLLGDRRHDRKKWIEYRLEELAEIFAVPVGGFSVLDNAKLVTEFKAALNTPRGCSVSWAGTLGTRRRGRSARPR